MTPVDVAWRDLFPTLAGGDAQTGAIMEAAHQLTLPRTSRSSGLVRPV